MECHLRLFFSRVGAARTQRFRQNLHYRLHHRFDVQGHAGGQGRQVAVKIMIDSAQSGFSSIGVPRGIGMTVGGWPAGQRRL